MSQKHSTPQWRRNSKLVRAEVRRLHALGEPVACWRCQRPIHPGQPFDVGHINDVLTSERIDLAPEHRHGNRACDGNRAAGGRRGAAITNGTRHPARASEAVTTWAV